MPALRLWSSQESEQKVDKHFVTWALTLGKALVVSVDMCSYSSTATGCIWIWISSSQQQRYRSKLKVAATCVRQSLLFDLGFLHVLLPTNFTRALAQVCPGVATLHVWFEVVCQASGFDGLIDKYNLGLEQCMHATSTEPVREDPWCLPKPWMETGHLSTFSASLHNYWGFGNICYVCNTILCINRSNNPVSLKQGTTRPIQDMEDHEYKVPVSHPNSW